jgi:PAS domain S-box-containing protein
VLDADGRVCGTLSSGEDITDRVRAEADLHENTVKLRALYELSPLGIALTDMSGRYIEFNEAFRKICGYSAEELRALDYWALTPRQYEAEEARQLDSLKSTGRYGPYEKAYLRKGGDLVPLQLSGVLITGQNGQSFIWSIVEDITERQLAKQALLELNVSLESRVTERTRELQATLESLRQAQDELVRSEKMASLGALVAGVAHELNTPIGNAMLVASTLEGRQREFEAAISGGLRRSSLDAFLSGLREASAVVERNLQRAADLIGSFKQVAVDQSSYQRREFDLAEVVQEISLALSPTLKRSGVKVLEHVPAGMRMDSHPGPLGQVLINLISNAATHAFEEGQMGSVRIAAEATGEGRVSLVVSDDGRGIPQHNLKRIFDPFFTTRLGQGGSGLGLHITYTLVTGLLGGRIEVRSEPGHGTAFTIQLPLVAPHGGTASNLMASDYHSTQL